MTETAVLALAVADPAAVEAEHRKPGGGDLRGEVRELALHHRAVERLVARGAEQAGEVRGDQLAQHHVAVGHGQRPAAAIARRARSGARRRRARAEPLASVWAPLRQPAFARLLGVFLVNGIASAVPATLVLFFIQDRLGADAAWQGVFLLRYFVAAALSMPLWARAVGRWGLARRGWLGMGLSVVASMSLGIIVDDTVHFLAKYQHARHEGRNAEAAVRYAFHSVGRALWITTAVLAIGFSVLMLSGFRLNSDMGLLTAIIIVTALVIDFLFLPAFLLKFDTKETKANV